MRGEKLDQFQGPKALNREEELDRRAARKKYLRDKWEKRDFKNIWCWEYAMRKRIGSLGWQVGVRNLLLVKYRARVLS